MEQRRRQLMAEEKARTAWEERTTAANEVAVHADAMDCLVSTHKEAGRLWDWVQIVARCPPPPPQPTHACEAHARSAADAYLPSLFDRWFGGAKKRRAQMEVEIAEAQRRDGLAFLADQAEHAQQLRLRLLAAGVIGGDLHAYRTVIKSLFPFAKLVESGMTVEVTDLRLDVALLQCAVSESAVPREEKKLTKAGKLTTKAMSTGTYWATYQDHVCGGALRAARELFALLPLPRVVVNVGAYGIDRSTGHQAYLPVLAVSMPRDIVDQLRFDTLDASDSMRNFPHRMKFKKTSGFELIEPLSADESFITTGDRR